MHNKGMDWYKVPDGLAVQMSRHTQPSFWKRLFNWVRFRRPAKLTESNLVTLEELLSKTTVTAPSDINVYSGPGSFKAVTSHFSGKVPISEA